MRSVLTAVAVALAVATSAGCGARTPAKNLVLFTLDTTRADRLGCYGSTSVQTPNLDRIARRGTIFVNALAVAPITAPSHASILSGTFPPFHQVRDNDVIAVPDGIAWLPEILHSHGYATAAIVAAFPLRSAMGFARGFDYFGDELEAPPGSFVMTNLHSVGVASRPGDRISSEFRRWLRERPRSMQPFFVWLHYYDPHWPWEPGSGYAELYADEPYDGEVAFMDDCIGRVIAALDEAGLTESTGIVAVGDHGEGLMDHGELTHALLLYNSTLRVPLIVSLPWLADQPERSTAFVSNADVMPTILDALDIDPAGVGQPIQARSLLPALQPSTGIQTSIRDDERAIYFETFYPYNHYRWSPLTGLTHGGVKYIHGPTDEVYDVLEDPGERRPISDVERLSELGLRLDQLTADLREGRPPTSRRQASREDLERLRALGYLGAEPAEDPESLDISSLTHPRDAMPIFFKYNDILGLLQRGRRLEALELAQSIADADPRQKDARLTVASLLVELGRFDAADRQFNELVDDFTDKDVVFQAGVYFLNRSNLERARYCFETLIARDPEDVEAITRLAKTAEASGQPDEAVRLLEQAVAVDPSSREARLELAVLLDRQGRLDANEQFAAVASRYPLDPRVNYDYAVFLLRRERDAEGLERLRRAAALSTGTLFAGAKLTEAAYYQRRGMLDEARACLREVVLQTDNPNALREAQARLDALGDR